MNRATLTCVAASLLGFTAFFGGCNPEALVVVENDGGSKASTSDSGKVNGTNGASGCTGNEPSCPGCCGDTIAAECTDASWTCPSLGCPVGTCNGIDAAIDAPVSTNVPPPPVTDDGGVPLPPECANPGPFNLPNSGVVTADMFGTWVYCSGSLFAGAPDAGGPPDQDVGVAFSHAESDGGFYAYYAFQKLGVSGSQLVNLTSATATGWWAPDAASTGDVTLTWWNSGGSFDIDVMFSADGRSMYVMGSHLVLAKAIGTP